MPQASNIETPTPRRCTKCKQDRPKLEFSKHSRAKDGLRSWCKSCCKASSDKYLSCPDALEKKREAHRRWKRENRDKVREDKRQWVRTEKGRAYNRHSTQLYYIRKQAAIPAWADLTAITEFYRNCPEGYEVDHIIPLRGETVCGLHVLENLQYLPKEENLRKGNKFNG